MVPSEAIARQPSSVTPQGTPVTLEGPAHYQAVSVLELKDAHGSYLLGTDVALSGSGTLVLVGAPGYRAGSGAAAFFKRDQTGWSQLGAPVLGCAGAMGLGAQVSLSRDGSAAAITGHSPPATAGTGSTVACFYTVSDQGWEAANRVVGAIEAKITWQTGSHSALLPTTRGLQLLERSGKGWNAARVPVNPSPPGSTHAGAPISATMPEAGPYLIAAQLTSAGRLRFHGYNDLNGSLTLDPDLHMEYVGQPSTDPFLGYAPVQIVLSGDGSTLLVAALGTPLALYRRTPSGWSSPTQFPAGDRGALSHDGQTAVYSDRYSGNIHFTTLRHSSSSPPSTLWAAPRILMTIPPADFLATGSPIGVDISADGQMILVGNPYAHSGGGQAILFSKTL